MRSPATFATNQRVPGRHPLSASGNNQVQWLRQNRPLIRGAFPGHNAHVVGQRWGLGQQAKRPALYARHSNDVLLDDSYGLFRETSLSADVCDQQKTDIENQKYVIPMFINEHSVNGIRDTGNFCISLVSRDLVSSSVVDYNRSIKVMGAFDQQAKSIPTTVVRFFAQAFDIMQQFLYGWGCVLYRRAYSVL